MKYEGRCLAGRDDCYGCGKSVHMMNDFPKSKANIWGSNQFSTSNVEHGTSKRNRFYILLSNGDQ